MRTTLEIDNDVLDVARDIAKSQGKSIGLVISAFARSAIQLGAATQAVGFESDAQLYRQLRELGVTPLPKTDTVVSDALVKRLRHDEGV